jgi:predicted phage tail protein
VSGSIVTLTWNAPVGGDPPTSYQVQAGSSAGQTNIASFDTGGTATSLAVFNVPAGTYYIRIRAVNSAGASGSSNEVQAVVGGAPPCASLAAPTGLVATINGTAVTLSWTAPTGCAPTSYVIQAGSTPGASNLANFSTGSTATSFTAVGVGPGTYYVRVLSAANGAASVPSTEIVFTVGTCGTAPNPPTNLQATVSGSTIVFTWAPPATGCTPASYLLQAGTASGASNLASVAINGTSFTASGVGNGTYYVRVLAVNAVGPSAPSNEVAVTVPSSAPPGTAIVAGFQFFDPGTQTAATTVCNIVSNLTSSPSVCQARSTSFTTGTNVIVSYDWTVSYFYGTAKTVSQTGTNASVTFGDTCGGPGSTDTGAPATVTVTMTVTDSLGNTATVTSGAGTQPALQLRLFKC